MKNRLKLISEDPQPKLWAYLVGIAKNHGMHAVAIGGIEGAGETKSRFPAGMTDQKSNGL